MAAWADADRLIRVDSVIERPLIGTCHDSRYGVIVGEVRNSQPNALTVASCGSEARVELLRRGWRQSTALPSPSSWESGRSLTLLNGQNLPQCIALHSSR